MPKRILLLILGTYFWLTSLIASTSDVLWIAHPTVGSFPVIKGEAQIEDPLFPSHPAVMVAYRAFRDVYGPLWYEHYVVGDERVAINRLANGILASLLPATPYVFRARVYPEYVYIPMQLSDADTLVKLDIFLQKDVDDRWKIGKISLR
jgi:hypothetical protein